MVAFVTALSVVSGPGPSAAAETDEPNLPVALSTISPTVLTPGQPITLAGTVTNRNDFTWRDLQAYLVIPRSPFTTRAQMARAISGSASYTGERIVDLGSIADLGDVEGGVTRSFSVAVPYESLGITGAEGVYPVGIQLLGTRPSGERSSQAIGRATTFIPLVAAGRPAATTSMLWPFVMPLSRDGDGNWASPERLVRLASPGGRLRDLVDLVGTLPPDAGTVLIDPALIDGLTDLVAGRAVRAADVLEPDAVAALDALRSDLIVLTRRASTWISGYDLPDPAAVAGKSVIATSLRDAVNVATERVVTQAGLPGRRVVWAAAPGGLDAGTVAAARSGDTATPLLVRSDAVPGWSRREGSVVSLDSEAGPVTTVVTDDLGLNVPGTESAVTLRQRILSEAAFASLERATDPTSRADAVTVVPLDWNPGDDWRAADLGGLWSQPFTRALTFDSLVLDGMGPTRGVPSGIESGVLDASVIELAADLAATGSALDAISVDTPAGGSATAVASIIGLRWRDNPSGALDLGQSELAGFRSLLAGIRIEGPPSFLLSSSTGQVPLTITNDTDRTIRVGVRISSSNPAITVPEIAPVDIAAGARDTVDVSIDVGTQSSSTLTARLIAADGTDVGKPTEFNVRASNVGMVVWIAMGLAGALLVVAVIRRLLRRFRDEGDAAPDDSPDVEPATEAETTAHE